MKNLIVVWKVMTVLLGEYLRKA